MPWYYTFLPEYSGVLPKGETKIPHLSPATHPCSSTCLCFGPICVPCWFLYPQAETHLSMHCDLEMVCEMSKLVSFCKFLLQEQIFFHDPE
jgi:hypothetical protein